jgi:uncharacterized pyridoxamine 5'-phosphate oxidase family protein
VTTPNSELEALIEQSQSGSTSFTKTIMPKTMNAEEIIAFINRQKNAIIATTRKNGFPHTAWNPVAYVNQKLYTYADPNSVFFKNLNRDGRVSLAIASGSRALFIEGRAEEVGKISNLIDSLLAKILSEVKGWIPESSYNYSSLRECQASIMEIKMSKILSYKE